MKQLIILFAVVFVIVLGVGLFFGYLSGLKYIKLPESPSGISSTTAQIESQKRFAAESKEQNQKMMQDYQFQIQIFRNNLKTTSP